MTARLTRLRTVFNVREFGAAGDGTTDDTTAIQAALTKASENGGTVLFPGTGSPYLVTDTLEILPTGVRTQVFVNLSADNYATTILWGGADDVAVFHSLGWKHSTVTGVKILLPATSSGVICWDLDTSVAIISISFVTFDQCYVLLGAGVNNVGWRLGHVSGGAADVSFMEWRNCVAGGGASGGISGQIGWLDEGHNSCNHCWFNGFGWWLDKMITSVGASSQSAGNHFVYGLGASGNALDFEEGAFGPLNIVGGRYEVGKRFYHSTAAGSACVLNVSGVQIVSYDPTDGIIFNCERQTSMHLDNVQIQKAEGTPYTSAMITLVPGYAPRRGTLMVTGGSFYADDPFFTDEGYQWDTHINGVGKISDGYFSTPTKFGEGPPSAFTTTQLTITAVSVSATAPVVYTNVAHGMVTGDWVHIDGIAELTAGYYKIQETGNVLAFIVSGTTTGDDTGTCQPCHTNRSSGDELVTVTGGTVTAIAISTDKGTTFTATGQTAGLFTLRRLDITHITNSAAPTTTKIPRP